jgi:tight adherence protein B
MNEESTYNPLNYNEYVMTKKEHLLYIFAAGTFIFAIGYIFYHSIILSLIITPLAFLYPKIKTKELMEKRKQELNLQFKDLIYSLSSSLSAGRSLESSFTEVLKDLSIIYPDEDTLVMKETRFIIHKLELNEPIEDILVSFAERTGIEDIKTFVDVIKSCRKAGGNLIEVIRSTTNIINDKIEIKNEIDTMLAEKKFEQRLMSMAPIFMILVLSLSAKDYMEPIFSTLAGRVAMTVAMITISITYFISQRIMKIKI